MNIKIVYYSRTGHTKLVADAMAEVLNVSALSVDDKNSKIIDQTDLLFIGGGLYAYGIDKHLRDYILSLDNTKIKKAVVFSTSFMSKHSIDLIKQYLKKQNIEVVEDYFYAKSRPNNEKLEEAKQFVKKFI